MSLGPRQAEAVVTSYLGRPPQDELEAAVVLESWGGVRPKQALTTAAQMAFPPAARSTSPRHTGNVTSPAPEGAVTTAEAAGALALVLAVLLLAAVASSQGASAAADAWRPAMPVTLGATWLLRRRYGAGRHAVAMLRRDSTLLVAGFVAVIAPLMALPPFGAAVGGFLALGVGGAVSVLRGWGAGTAALVAAVAGASVLLDVGPGLTMAGAVGVVAVAAVVAVATSPMSGRRAQPWRRAVPAGIAGSTTGAFLVLISGAAQGAETWVVAAALAPSLLANLAGGAHLTRFWEDVPEALSRVPLHQPSTPARWVAIRLLAGTAALVAGLLLALSLAVRAVVDAVDPSPAIVPLLLGFGALAVVTLVVTLLEAFAKPWWATTTGVAAFGAHLGFTELHWLSIVATLAVAVAAALVVAAPPITALLRRPEHTLATIV